MLAIVSKLLKGSGVSEVTHPSLVGLLELAARGSGIPSGSKEDTPATRKRLLRDWYRVCEAFRACVAAGAEDADFTVLAYDVAPLEVRAAVAKALEGVAASKASAGNEKLSTVELKVLLCAFKKAIAVEKELKKALKAVGYEVYGAGVQAYIETLSGTMKAIKEDNS